MKTAAGWTIALLAGLVLAGCTEKKSDPQSDPAPQATPAAIPDPKPAPEEPAPAPPVPPKPEAAPRNCQSALAPPTYARALGAQLLRRTPDQVKGVERTRHHTGLRLAARWKSATKTCTSCQGMQVANCLLSVRGNVSTDESCADPGAGAPAETRTSPIAI